MELVKLTASANLKPKDLENTVEVVENIAKTTSLLDGADVTEVSFLQFQPASFVLQHLRYYLRPIEACRAIPTIRIALAGASPKIA